MLTKLTIRNFKRFREVEIELGERVVFIGPNNSGKTAAIQALALWEVGVKLWHGKYPDGSAPRTRPGVTVNRRDLVSIPHPVANLLWRGRRTREISKENGKQGTENVRIDIVVEGVTEGKKWECGLEFDYANAESFYCRPLRRESGRTPERMAVPPEAAKTKTAFLPPMSGLAATEDRLDPGSVDVRVGEGRTAEVLRNLCYRISEGHPDKWEALVEKVAVLFGTRLGTPRYIPGRGEITLSYREPMGHRGRDVELDLSSSGRGLQQTLLVLTHMHINPGAVIMLDEPDAHLEILRQRQIYDLISEAASASGSQIIAASHSEVLLGEAAERDMVIAFVGKPHRVAGRGGQIRKALRDVGYDQYFLAEQTGWVLYLEGATDLAILKAFAARLGRTVDEQVLGRPFVHYVKDRPKAAANHFYALKEAVPDLKGVALFDRLENAPKGGGGLECLHWRQREIENYLCTPETLASYARHDAANISPGPLFASQEADRRCDAMRESISDVMKAKGVLQEEGDPWGADAKVSDSFLEPVFRRFFHKLGLPNLMGKTDFHVLVDHVPENEIDPEISEKLDAIAAVAAGARPAAEE